MLALSCVVFAGGKSSRMHQDKALLPFGGYSSLTEFQYKRLQNIFQEVYIVTKTPEKFSFKASFIKENYNVYAPTAGFVSVFEALNNEHFFVLGVDLPFVDEGIIKEIYQADRNDVDATIAQTVSFTESMCGIYHRSLEKTFKKMLQENKHKLHQTLKEKNTQMVLISEEWRFKNLNTPQEYQKALQLYDIIKKKESL